MAGQVQNQIAFKTPMPQRTAGSGIVLTPKDIWLIFRRHIFLVTFFTILGIIFGGVGWFLMQKYHPKYTAMTVIEVLSPIEKDPLLMAIPMVGKDIQYSYRMTIASLLTQQNSLQELINRAKVQETKWFINLGEIKSKRISKAFENLKNNFSASAFRDGDFVQLSMTCGKAEESALIVNEMVDWFFSWYGSTKREDVSERLTSLDQQQKSLQTEVLDAERSLEQVRTTYGFIDLDEKSFEDTVTRRLNDLEIQQNNLVLSIQQTETAIKNLERLATGPINEQIERLVENDPIMISLKQRLSDQEVALSGRLTKFGENHREVIQIKELIKKTKEEREKRSLEISEQTRQSNLQDALDQQRILVSQLQTLLKMRDDSEKTKKGLDQARVLYKQRKVIKDDAQKRLDEVKEAITKLHALYGDPETPRIKRVGLAPVPLRMSSPRLVIYIPGGTFLGFALGAGLAFLIELMNDLVRTPRDVKRYLNIPLLGIVPDAEDDELADGINLYHIVRDSPYSFLSESYRKFRTNLKLSIPESSKVILISSGMAGEGKTSVAVNLAETLVTDNKKVLLIDANFWRPALHKVFAKTNPQQKKDKKAKFNEVLSEFGLSTLLSGLCSYTDAIKPSGTENLDLIESGLLPSNPAELLGGTQMEKLIKHQREFYDYIIVDSAPVLLVGAVKSLARIVDGTILVFNGETTRRGTAVRTISELKEVNASFFGCVLLAVKALKGGYFSEQFKSYQQYQKLQMAVAQST